jgi:hypothetical protein
VFENFAVSIVEKFAVPIGFEFFLNLIVQLIASITFDSLPETPAMQDNGRVVYYTCVPCQRDFNSYRALGIHRAKKMDCRGKAFQKHEVKAPTNRAEDRLRGGGVVQTLEGQ